MTKNIAIVVLGCASPPYDVMIYTIRNTRAGVKAPGIDIYYSMVIPMMITPGVCCPVM